MATLNIDSLESLAAAQAWLESLDKLEPLAAPEVLVDPYPNVPQEMKEKSQWVTWNGESKQPFVSGTTTPLSKQNWVFVTYDEAIQNIRNGLGYQHLGFFPDETYKGVDMDSCRNPQTGEIQQWAMDFLGTLPPTYVEVTPSQTGLRAWVKMTDVQKKLTLKIKPELAAVATKAPQVELLVHNYGTITGSPYNGFPAVAEVTMEQWTNAEQALARYAPQQQTRTSTSGAADEPPVDISIDGAPIPHGQHDRTLYRIACNFREQAMEKQEALDRLLEICRARCINYGSDYVDMCEKKIASAWKHEEGKPVGTLIFPQSTTQIQANAASAASAGEQGTMPQTDVSQWRKQFRNLSEMEQGDPVMIIDGVLQEGTCFVGANPGNGKTLVALALAKSICLGEPLFGIPEYKVKRPRNVIYLIPEVGDKPFRKRGEAFRLPADDRFIARTISSGGPLALSDPALMEAVRQTKPVVILDTASRFLQANDENSAAQNRLLVNDIVALRAAGAVCVIILHHAKKSQTTKREAMTLDNMLRGTSDFGAMCDQAYGIRMDEHLHNRGAGPMEIELVNLKDRERLGGLTSIRLAASYKTPGDAFPKSYIDQTGNFRLVDYKETKARDEETLNALVQANPMMTITELAEATGLKVYTVKETLKKFGWHCVKGGLDGRSPWHKDDQGCPYQKARKAGSSVNLGSTDLATVN